MKAWVSKMLSEGDGTPSVKRVLFALSVAGCLSFTAGHIVAHRGLDSAAIDLAKTTLLTTGTAYGVGRITEATEKK
jgi:hypothetical protein